MAMEIFREIPSIHEENVVCIAFDRARKAVYTVGDGDTGIKVWDLKTGALLRTQSAHTGAVTACVFLPSRRLLVSGSIDGALGVWSDKGTLLQLMPTGGPIYSLAWSEQLELLAAGGRAALHVLRVDSAAATRVRHARQAAAAAAAPAAGAGGDEGAAGGGKRAGAKRRAKAAAAAVAAMPAAHHHTKEEPILTRVCPVFRGAPHPIVKAAADAASRSRRVTMSAADGPAAAAAGCGTAAAGGGPGDAGGGGAAAPDQRPRSPNARGEDNDGGAQGSGGDSDGAGADDADATAAAAAAAAARAPRDADFWSACNTDAVAAIAFADSGRMYTAGFDRAICIYDVDKLDKGRAAVTRVKDCARAAITSLAVDARTGALLAGSLDGALRVWSPEGRCMDRFEGLRSAGGGGGGGSAGGAGGGGGGAVRVVALAKARAWWATGRRGRVEVFDPRAPAPVTPYVAAANGLEGRAVEFLHAPPPLPGGGGGDVVFGATRARGLVAWRYNPRGAHRVFKAHDEWVEDLVVLPPPCAGLGPGAGSPRLGLAGAASAAAAGGGGERVLTAAGDGRVRVWELDVERGCDVFSVTDEFRAASCAVRCLAYDTERGLALAGCADGAIRAFDLDGRDNGGAAGGGGASGGSTGSAAALGPPRAHGAAFEGHCGAVTGLAVIDGDTLLSAGRDGTLRLWDLETRRQIACEHAAGAAASGPVTCLDWCPERREAAVCASGARAYVWGLRKRGAPRLLLALDHLEPPPAAAASGGGGGRASPAAGVKQQQQKPALGHGAESSSSTGGGGGTADATATPPPTNMRWLTRSDVAGDGSAATSNAAAGGDASGRKPPHHPPPPPPPLPPLVAEAVRDAARDVPEVTQVRWAGFRGAWVTAADDGALRLWSPLTGARIGAPVRVRGGRVGALYVDDARELLLLATDDRAVAAYSLDAGGSSGGGAGAPVARYVGHGDAVAAVAHSAALDMYLTGSWDGTMRAWPLVLDDNGDAAPSRAAPSRATSRAVSRSTSIAGDRGGGALRGENSSETVAGDGVSGGARTARSSVGAAANGAGPRAAVTQQQHQSSRDASATALLDSIRRFIDQHSDDDSGGGGGAGGGVGDANCSSNGGGGGTGGGGTGGGGTGGGGAAARLEATLNGLDRALRDGVEAEYQATLRDQQQQQPQRRTVSLVRMRAPHAPGAGVSSEAAAADERPRASFKGSVHGGPLATSRGLSGAGARSFRAHRP